MLHVYLKPVMSINVFDHFQPLYNKLRDHTIDSIIIISIHNCIASIQVLLIYKCAILISSGVGAAS